jgi:hypothetical protein
MRGWLVVLILVSLLLANAIVWCVYLWLTVAQL